MSRAELPEGWEWSDLPHQSPTLTSHRGHNPPSGPAVWCLYEAQPGSVVMTVVDEDGGLSQPSIPLPVLRAFLEECERVRARA